MLFRSSKPKIKAIKSTKAKKMTITLKSKVKGANGYQIRYSQKKSMKSAKKATMKKSSILKKTIKGLKKGKKYYVQVRAYKTVGKKNYFSSWSTKKSITIKKK